METHTHGLVGRRVLVIEDEPLVMMFLADILADMGCEVVGQASHFNDAMEKANSLSFDVAILDVDLRGKPTFPIADALLSRGTPFLFASGYGSAGLPAALQTIPTLQKPFQQADLEKMLLAILAR